MITLCSLFLLCSLSALLALCSLFFCCVFALFHSFVCFLFLSVTFLLLCVFFWFLSFSSLLVSLVFLILRVETGRWETAVMSGKQVKLPRSFRMCTLCFEEVEDAEHTLFRCPCFKKLRTAFLEGSERIRSQGERQTEMVA